MKVTIENMESRVARKVEFYLNEMDIDPNEIENDDRSLVYGTLVVEFMNGRTYEYADVMCGTFADLINAVSFGRFLNWEIKPSHKVREITPINA